MSMTNKETSVNRRVDRKGGSNHKRRNLQNLGIYRFIQRVRYDGREWR